MTFIVIFKKSITEKNAQLHWPLAQATGAYSHLDLLGNLRKASLNYPHRRSKEVVLPRGSCLPLAKMPSWTSIPSYFQVVCVSVCVCVCVCVCAQSCLILCDPMVWNLPGSSVHGISQARKLEWVAISYSRGASQPRDQTHISCLSCIGRWILYRWTIWEALRGICVNANCFLQ